MKLFDVYSLFEIEIESGSGVYVFDNAGNRYLDFYGGHAVISIGHAHPHFNENLKRQIDKICFYSNSVINPLQHQLALELEIMIESTDYQLFLVNSGAEANENALKLASFFNGRTKVLAFKNGFHGRTSAAVNVTDNRSIQAPINRTFEVVMAELNDYGFCENVLSSEDTCAVIIEGIQGIGGIYTPAPDFLQFLEEKCRETNTILILDEIQSGYGRSGQFFSYQTSGIQPDIVTMAKGMGNGFPIGGLLIHRKFEPAPGLLGSTFGGNHLACVAGISVLEVLKEENLVENARLQGDALLEGLRGLPGLVELRGRGLMLGIEMDFPVKEFRHQLLTNEKIFTGSATQTNTIRLLPPLNVGTPEVEEFVTKFESRLNHFLKQRAAHA